MFLTTVVFPEPEPPAIPMINICFSFYASKISLIL